MKKPYVIAISGCSGSGKSTFSELLQSALSEYRVGVLTTDGYFNRPLPKMVSPLSEKEYDDYNCPESLNFEAYLEDATKMTQRQDLDIVILEGLTVLYFKELRELEDLKIYLDLDAEIRMYRRIVRNMARGRGTMDEIADYYLNSAKYSETKYLKPTKLYADIVLNGHNYQNLGKDIVLSYIKSQIG